MKIEYNYLYTCIYKYIKMLSNLDSNIKLINLATSINCLAVYMHVDWVYLMNNYTYIKTDNFIDYVLDKYSP